MFFAKSNVELIDTETAFSLIPVEYHYFGF
jgi:hypothetical protein